MSAKPSFPIGNFESEQRDFPWFSMVLPPKALVFIVLFLVLFPLVALVAESFVSPLYSLLLGVMMPFSQRMGSPEMPLILLVKVSVFGVIAFGTLGLILMRILTIYHQAWAHVMPQVHSLHSPFHPDPKLSLVAIINWLVYRSIRIMAWPLGLFVCAGIAMIACLMMMQFLSEGFLILAQLLIMIILFAFLISGYFMMICLVKAFGDYFTTTFGSTATLLEPEQPAEVIYDRVRRLAFYSPWFILVYAQQVLTWAVFSLSVIGIFKVSNIDQVLGFGAQWPIVIMFSALTLGMILIRFGLQFFVYSDSLKRFYRQHS